MSSKPDNDKIDKLIKSIGANNDAAGQLQRAAQGNDTIARALGSLTDSDIAKITAVLGDKEATARIMSTPKAQELLKKLKG